jgi:YD repeat-containing protein
MADPLPADFQRHWLCRRGIPSQRNVVRVFWRSGCLEWQWLDARFPRWSQVFFSRVSTQTLADGQVVRYEYLFNGHHNIVETTVTLPNGKQQRFTFRGEPAAEDTVEPQHH